MTITIGEVAKRSDIGIETIRFYEREGLIDDPPRTEAGYRQYPDDVILRVRFIRQAKELGFSLKDIKELLSLRPCGMHGLKKQRTPFVPRVFQPRIRRNQDENETSDRNIQCRMPNL